MKTLPHPVRLETDRLVLRQWQDSDIEPYAALNADARVMEHFPAPLTREASDAMALKCQKLIEERGWGLWAVELRESGQFIGHVGLHVPFWPLPFSPCVEIGWRLAFSAWGRGLATEAARAALRVGFEEAGLQEIVSFTALSNVRSQAVMERLGMKRAPANFAHPALPPDSPLLEHCLYRLRVEDWRASLD
ncbi:MAG: GNAT family N-acetyltransferase [Verrucomicrobium sp.]|nr:GNAT family N-acetyltransferase [Verrucomicrobium sp.]